MKMKVKVELRVIKSIKQDGVPPRILHSLEERMPPIEVVIPDEWLEVIKVLPRSYIHVSVEGEEVIEVRK